MAVKRFTGKDLTVLYETSDGNMVEIPNVVEARVSDGEAEKVQFEGGDFIQVGHGMRTYFVEVDFEVDATDSSAGNWYVAKQVDRLDEDPRKVQVYPYGTTAGNPYFEQDSIHELSVLDSLSKNGKGMAMVRSDPHVQATETPDWQSAPAAST